MILPEDIYLFCSKVDKLKHVIYDDNRPREQKELAHKILNDVMFAID